jgi:hypothetical protein
MFVLVQAFSYVACFMYIASIELDSSGNFLFLDFTCFSLRFLSCYYWRPSTVFDWWDIGNLDLL